MSNPSGGARPPGTRRESGRRRDGTVQELIDMRARKLGAIGRAARALQDADQIDHGVASGEQLIERGVVMHVGFHHIDGRQSDQVSGGRAASHRYRDLEAATDEAGKSARPAVN